MSDNYITTHSGKRVHIQNPDPSSIDLHDIAWSLSRIPRFHGSLDCFWSVAQHSLAVEHHLEKLGASKEVRLTGLMHDTPEYVMGDIPTPFKASIPMLKALEWGIWASICIAFQIKHEIDDLIKGVDKKMLLTERRDLGSIEMVNAAKEQPWHIDSLYRPFDEKLPRDFVSFYVVQQRFIDKFNELKGVTAPVESRPSGVEIAKKKKRRN